MSEKNTANWADQLIAETEASLPANINEGSTDLSTEVASSLSDEEKTKIVEESDLAPEQKGLLGSLIEINKTAQILKQIDSEESVNERNQVLNLVMNNFVQKRFMSNLKLETLKEQIIDSVMENLDNLDLVTRIDTMEKIHNMTVLDAQKAGGGAVGSGNGIPAPGVNITLNNASGNGTVEATQNTLNVNTGVTTENLKDVASLSATMKSMKESGAPRKVNPTNVTDTEFKEK